MKATDMKAAATFSLFCVRCDRKVANKVTAYTIGRVASLHDDSHRRDDAEDGAP